MLRATLQGLLHRKLRLALAVVAVLLGVGFVSGANVLTDSLSAGFDKLFATVNANVAVQVRPDTDSSQDAEPPRLTEADLAEIDAIDGVAAVYGDASAEGVVPFHTGTGKAVQTGGAPSIGFGVNPGEFDDPESVLLIADGGLPDEAGEVAVTRHTATVADAGIGDLLTVYLPRSHQAREFTVVGILEYTGDRGSLGGETMIGFTLAEAQRLLYGEEGVYSGASVISSGDATDAELKQRVAAVIPAGFEAKTGTEVAAEQAGEIKEGLRFINWFFLSFALVALLVGVFLIFNTFTIVAAQRSRELALYRALGASRRQVTGTMLVEALVVGAVGSALGLGFGVGIAAGVKALFGLLGVQLPDGGIVVAGATVLIAFVTGIGVTVFAALLPAVRASGVPPIAAMRDVVKPDKPLRWLVTGGLVLAAGGAVMTGIALRGAGDATLQVLGAGVLLVFLGVALLSPVLTWPVAGLVGGLLSWGAASKLGRRNALRNPRRTAVTAAALMIGVTLVSALTMLGASFKATTVDLVSEQLGADVIVTTMNRQGPPSGRTGFDPRALDEVREIPGVRDAVALHAAAGPVDGRLTFIGSVDIGDGQRMFGLDRTAGEVRDLDRGEALVEESIAEDRGWRVGDEITVSLPTGGDRSYTLVGVYGSSMISGVLLPESAVRYFGGPLAYQGYITLEDGTDSGEVVSRVEKIMADYPFVRVGDRTDLVEQITTQIDIALNIFNVLLLLAVVIAFLGILNTLLLSIYERTRELGMLRAIGMARRQVKRMIRVESVIMSVFGCLLGVALGLALGYAAATTLVDLNQLTTIALPGVQLVGFVVIAIVAGVVAAWWPAFRAARLNVLEAIAYE